MNLPSGAAARWVTPLAGLLVAAQLAVRAWVGLTGWFSLDDYVFYTRAAELPLWSRELLLTDYNGHLMPGSMVWVWLTTDLAPLNLEAVLGVSLGLQLLVDVLMLVVLRRLFGNRPAILVPFALFVCTTMTLPAMVWWSAALNQLPQQLFMLLAFLAHLHYLRTEQLRHGLLGVVAMVAGLAFSEKTALIVPLLFAFTWLVVVGGPLLRGLGETVRLHRRLWLGYAVTGLAYAGYYATEVDSPARSGATLQQAIELADVATRRTVVPGLLGGPWTWKPLGVVDSLADPPMIAQVVAVAIVAAVIGYSVWLSRGALRAWSLLGLGLAAELGLLLFTRVQVVGVEAVAAEYRYFTDLAIVASLATGLAFLPVTAKFRRPAPEMLRPAQRPDSVQRAVTGAVHLPTIAVIGAAGLVASSGYSAATYQERWSANPGRDYFANAIEDLTSRHAPVVLYDGPVPTAVVWRLLWPATLPSRLLPPTGAEIVPFRVGQSTAQLYDLAADGRLRPSQVNGIALRRGPDSCGWRLGPTPRAIPLDDEAFNWNWVVRLDYSVSAPVDLELEAGSTRASALLDPGRSSVFVYVTGEVDEIDVSVSDSSSQACVSGGVVGLPQPVEW